MLTIPQQKREIERLQKIAAFSCFAFLEERGVLAILVLSTGLVTDLVDIFFQGKSLRSRYLTFSRQDVTTTRRRSVEDTESGLFTM